ncbi:dehydrogenase/reductase SDR family member 11-like [Daktulosphaira vitifoliae]|uniref:dehydrogenase/reductase SDR family member 11-like n=1 Tax=Daktulosphaira vitifoliae TaxID=58002 RepID=UPI0021AAA512|nr:dehydrogenase/reductase SDR family member 11-like [Daktulosphaira vitifoliae]
MDKWIGKVAIVTGASSGIGAAACKKLVQSGMIVVGFARRENNLKSLADELKGQLGEFHYYKVDVCNEYNILEAFEWIKRTFKSVDVLINNAAVLKYSSLLEGSTEDWKLMYETNVIGSSICSREAVKLIKEFSLEKGHIININSVSGHFRIPITTIGNGGSTYFATKVSLASITESLRESICQQNLPIRVTSISPGVVITEMTAGNEALDTYNKLKAEDIADAILYALGAPQHVNVCELIIRPTGEFFV